MKKIFLFIGGKATSITLAKFISAFITIAIVSLVKYAISGGFYLEFSNIIGNISIGLLGWTVNQSLITILTDWLSLNGLNFNFKQLLFGFQTSENSNIKIEKVKIKRYNAMESDNNSGSAKPLDKGKGIDQTIGSSQGLDFNRPPSVVNNPTTETPQPLPFTFTLPTRTNPGPGFNVPGGEVPIRDDICKYIGYNSHILKQFKTMDLETAIEERNNNLNIIQVLNSKIAFAQNALAKIPTIPTTEYEFRLKDKIISDLNDMNNNILRAQGRATLLNSRLEFIEINRDNKN